MRPLTLDDLLPLAEFQERREEFFEAYERYAERYRRIRVGPSAVLLFENRQTLWFRAQEILRILRLQDPDWMRAELGIINLLLPGRHELAASLLHTTDVQPESLRLRVGDRSVNARIESARPEDRAMGTAQWMRFVFTPDDRRQFADVAVAAWIEIDALSSDQLSDEMRQSLLDDLEASDRA